MTVKIRESQIPAFLGFAWLKYRTKSQKRHTGEMRALDALKE